LTGTHGAAGVGRWAREGRTAKAWKVEQLYRSCERARPSRRERSAVSALQATRASRAVRRRGGAGRVQALKALEARGSRCDEPGKCSASRGGQPRVGVVDRGRGERPTRCRRPRARPKGHTAMVSPRLREAWAAHHVRSRRSGAMTRRRATRPGARPRGAGLCWGREGGKAAWDLCLRAGSASAQAG